MTYDALNRLASKEYPATPSENISYTYDDTTSGNKGVGFVTGMSDPAGSTAYRYDDRGNRILETRITSSQTFSTAYSYDDAGRVSAITYPSGRMAIYTRDTLGRITGVATRDTSSSPIRQILTGATYLPFGPLASFIHANGIVIALSHDLDYRLIGITATDGASAVQDQAYTWDAANNLRAISDNVSAARSQAFDYDALDRLEQAQGQYGTLNWTYDEVSNRLTTIFDDGTGPITDSYTYAPTSNRLTSVDNTGILREFTYTAAGNVETDDRGPADDRTFSYGPANRLITVATSSATLATMLYDGFDRRVMRQAGGSTRIFHYDLGNHLIATSDAAGDNWVEIVWLDDLPVAQVESNSIYAVHTDQLGQPAQMTDGTHVVVWDRTQRPFGLTESETGSPNNPLRFPGQVSDPETETHHNMARDYDPKLGRYLQSDPIGISGGLNTYAYASNNPTGLTDPSGQFVQGFVIGAGIGAFIDVGLQLYGNGGEWGCINWWHVGQSALIGGAIGLIPELWAARGGWAGLFGARGVSAGGAGTAGRGTFGGAAGAESGTFGAPGSGVSGGGAGAIDGAVPLSSLGANVNRGFDFGSKQLQAKFKHAADFGVEGSYSGANATKFEAALQRHVSSETTNIIPGTYRGHDVTHFVDPQSGLNVIRGSNGELISGWRLTPDQLRSVLGRGKM